GIVDAIYQKEGEMASPGFRLIQLVNLAKLKVNADLSEHYLASVKKGDNVTVTFPAYDDIEFNVPIFRTGNVVKLDNRTFTIEVKLDNIDKKLKPGIISIIHINDYTKDSSFVVPSIILKRDVNNKFFLFVVEKKGDDFIAKKTYVKAGKSYKDETEILSGLKEGQQVIVEGYSTVSTGTKILIKE
ncbi:MAG: efflux RND transporter periplasmic adaptor subunit, partial [Saprospiraceae bacterium]|nr:efflux RND transporter periplasmic adaptor subunit [Saprospiraceae bacterium]